MDEAVIAIRDKKFWLWRAIDADGDVLDILVQARRNTKAAKRFFSHLIKQFGEPRVVVTDKPCSYIKPIQNLAQDADHRANKLMPTIPCANTNMPTIMMAERIADFIRSQLIVSGGCCC